MHGSACSCSNPKEIELLLSEDTTPLPFLRSALRLHLRRFPSVRNGLGHMEQMALDCIARGVTRFPELFREWSAAEPGYGLGDAQLWDVLIRYGRVPAADAAGSMGVKALASLNERIRT